MLAVLAERIEHEIRIVWNARQLPVAVRNLERVQMLLEIAIGAQCLVAVANDLADEPAGA